jgi:hypothetical protein
VYLGIQFPSSFNALSIPREVARQVPTGLSMLGGKTCPLMMRCFFANFITESTIFFLDSGYTAVVSVVVSSGNHFVLTSCRTMCVRMPDAGDLDRIERIASSGLVLVGALVVAGM